MHSSLNRCCVSHTPHPCRQGAVLTNSERVRPQDTTSLSCNHGTSPDGREVGTADGNGERRVGGIETTNPPHILASRASVAPTGNQHSQLRVSSSTRATCSNRASLPSGRGRDYPLRLYYPSLREIVRKIGKPLEPIVRSFK